MQLLLGLGQLNLRRFGKYEADRIPNVPIGKNCRIMTNEVLKKYPQLRKFINDETMSALDNYAEHENVNIRITPLENDLFNDLKVSVHRKGQKDVYFPINIAKTKEEVPVFLRDLYNKIHIATHNPTEAISSPVHKNTKLESLKIHTNSIINKSSHIGLKLAKKIFLGLFI